MKKSQLQKQIAKLAHENGVVWRLKRQGGKHEVWEFQRKLIIIPRHRELSEMLAKKIIQDCLAELNRE